MCVGCGGTCAPPQGPRFIQHAGAPDLRVVGANMGPTTAPDSVVRQTGGLITYEDLYTGLAPDGQPAVMILPGTFGAHATRARVGR